MHEVGVRIIHRHINIFFSTDLSCKRGVRIIHSCGLHTGKDGTCFNSFAKKSRISPFFPLHNYLYIICDMITYNLGKVNHVTKWFSNLYLQFHSDG